jgi:hypothetical protein
MHRFESDRRLSQNPLQCKGFYLYSLGSPPSWQIGTWEVTSRYNRLPSVWRWPVGERTSLGVELYRGGLLARLVFLRLQHP